MNERPKSYIKFIIQLVISVSLLVFIFLKIDTTELLAHADKLNYAFLVLLLLTCIADRVNMAFKWRLLLLAKGINVSLLDTVKVYMFSTFVGLFLPVSVGADVVRGFRLYKDGHYAADIAASIVIERFLGFIAAAIVALICAITFVTGFRPDAGIIIWPAAILLAMLVAAFIISLKFRFLSRYSDSKNYFLRIMKRLYDSYSSYADKDKTLAIFLLLSVFSMIFPILANYLAAKALGIHLPFYVFLISIPLVQLIARMPISIGGLGVSQVITAMLFLPFGVSMTQAVIISLLSDLIGAISVVPGIFFSTKSQNGKLDDIKDTDRTPGNHNEGVIH